MGPTQGNATLANTLCPRVRRNAPLCPQQQPNADHTTIGQPIVIHHPWQRRGTNGAVANGQDRQATKPGNTKGTNRCRLVPTATQRTDRNRSTPCHCRHHSPRCGCPRDRGAASPPTRQTPRATHTAHQSNGPKGTTGQRCSPQRREYPNITPQSRPVAREYRRGLSLRARNAAGRAIECQQLHSTTADSEAEEASTSEHADTGAPPGSAKASGRASVCLIAAELASCGVIDERQPLQLALSVPCVHNLVPLTGRKNPHDAAIRALRRSGVPHAFEARCFKFHETSRWNAFSDDLVPAVWASIDCMT